MAPQAGPIGGWGQKSKYKIDCRFPRATLIKRLEQAANLSDRVEICESSLGTNYRRGSDLVRSAKLRREPFFYFDPPFFEKADMLYAYYFKNEQHTSFRDVVINLQLPWILSYDVAKFARKFSLGLDFLVGLCFYVGGPKMPQRHSRIPAGFSPCRRSPSDGDQQTLARVRHLPSSARVVCLGACAKARRAEAVI